MNVSSISSYTTTTYDAIVVNSDYTQDPNGEYRVQIYIPSMHTELAEVYETYMNTEDKQNSEYFSKFPWAKSMVKNLKDGAVVFGSYMNNVNTDYILLGLDANNPENADLYDTNTSNSTSGAYSVSGGSLLDLTMPIILYNEVSVPITDYPDNISNDEMTTFVSNDNGAWSIGLIQWNASRAYDMLLYVTKNFTNWANYWTDKSLDLYKHLSTGESSYRTKYGKGFTPAENGPVGNSVKNLLTQDEAQMAELDYAKQDIQEIITLLVDDNEVTNPAICIYVTDIMNQYGTGLSGTKAKAKELSAESTYDNMINKLDEMYTWTSNNFSDWNATRQKRKTTKGNFIYKRII